MAGKQFSLDSRMDLVSTMNADPNNEIEKEAQIEDEEEEKGRTSSFS